MEKGPEIRIVGGASQEEKEKAKQEIKKYFGERHLESLTEESKRELEKFEYPKTPEELRLIDFANRRTNELMRKAGVPPYNVSTKNLHILPPEIYGKATDAETNAATFQKNQAIILNAENVKTNPLAFGKIVFHELMHLKGHFALEVEETKKRTEQGEEIIEVKKTPFREGLAMRAAQKRGLYGQYHTHFSGLTEGLIASQEKAYIEEMLKLPMFKQERKRLNSEEIKELKKEIAEKERISQEDIFWISPDGKEYRSISYPSQREAFRFLTTEIQKEFPDKYKSFEEVSAEFLKGHFTGRVLSIARLIERTFGKGGFEVLGMMDENYESAVRVLEYLRRARSRKSD